ncbi:hypothetical protein LTR84_001739 [Exophiala bonariae]|uniref:Major facilitator superfamily (MFS) profile domain-containing protein n=1 Tax=Exophiala bonariae TaxID=1690606 RepID=A0AAV9NBB8_9EURO|nr:hypothetical protein LTR84_001739 [Exophiala bonariae]
MTDTEAQSIPRDRDSEHDVQPTAAPPLLQTLSLVPSNTPQDGGRRAWIQVLGCFLIFFNVWGYPSVWGAFQEYYASNLLSENSPGTIAWIGSTQSTLLILVGILSGPIFDLGYYQTLMFAGAIICVSGVMLVSLATKYWQVMLCQGICVGLGCGMIFIPTLALVTRSFQRRRALAVATVFSGTPVGAIMYGFVFSRLIGPLGYPWTARSLAFMMMGIFAVSLPLVLWGASNTGQITDGRKRRMLDKAALTDPPFWAYTVALSTMSLAYWVPYYYIPTFARSALGTSQAWSSYLLMIAQAASVFGRYFAAIAADHFGVMLTWLVTSVISGAVCLVWIGVTEFKPFIAFCVLWGITSGPLVPLPASIFPVVCPNRNVLGTRLGMSEAIASAFNLIGPPIAGALMRKDEKKTREYLAVQMFAGLILIGGGVQLLYLWWYLVKKRSNKVFI